MRESWIPAAMATLCSLAACGPSASSGANPKPSGGDAASPANEDASAPPASADASSSAPTEEADATAPSSPDATTAPPTMTGPSPTDAAAASAPDAIVPGDAGSGCPGVPIVPDDGGFVAPGSNSVGIHGSWFVYSDCTDLQGKNCAMVTSPGTTSFPNTGGALCTSGTTSTAAGAWGAGIALELNDGPPQMPFDTTAAGIKGFCFELTGSAIPATTVRVAFPTQDNNDNAYFEAESTAGQHTVLFSDIAQGSWVTTPQPFEPTKVMLIQFQIPSSTTAPVPWNFCIQGLTAITQ